MDAAVAALIGAGIGVVSSLVTTLFTVGREDRRRAADLQDARDARLFDHRREAYAEFLRSANSLLDGAWSYHAGLLPDSFAPPDYDFTDPLVERRALVSLYGTKEADSAADRVIRSVAHYGGGSGADDDYGVALGAIADYTEVARRDLGVVE